MTVRDVRKALERKMRSLFWCTDMAVRRMASSLTRPGELRLIRGNKKYKNIHKGQRCFIIGNGPSLKGVDLAKLKDEITFTVNQIPRMKDFPKIHTNYHIWTDESFYYQDFSTPEGKDLLEIMKGVNTDGNRPVVFYKTNAKKMIKDNHLDEFLDICYLMEGYRFRDPHLDLPMDRVICRFNTCVQYFILMAVYMGFSEIYLLGCDCTHILNTIHSRMETAEKMEYVYECSDHELKRLRIWQKRPLEDEIRDYVEMFSDYRRLNAYCEHHGVKLYNATRGSLLEGIEKVRIEDIL